MSLLEIENLSVDFKTVHGRFRAVDNISLSVDAGEVIGIVGESGSGKSVSMLALMGLLPWTARITADSLCFDGQDLLSMRKTMRRQILGRDMAMIFQEPMTSLNPCFTVGYQIEEVLKAHRSMHRKERKEYILHLLDLVGIPDPQSRVKVYPHQMSGGMSQRIMIAMMLACRPKLLIADEPTTALDVTIQAQILELLLDLQQKENMALILITHDMGVVAETARTVYVQYAGQQVEHQNVHDLFYSPRHPYTQALLSALPERAVAGEALPTIPGVVPGARNRPTGCLFNPRCQYVKAICKSQVPPTIDGVLCHFPISYPDNDIGQEQYSQGQEGA